MLSQPTSVPDTPSLLPVSFPAVSSFLLFSILMLFLPHASISLLSALMVVWSQECPLTSPGTEEEVLLISLPVWVCSPRTCEGRVILCLCYVSLSSSAEVGSQQQVTGKNTDKEEEERYQLPLSFSAAWHSNYILKLGIQRNYVPWLWCRQLVQRNLNKWDFSACCRSCCLLGAVKEVFQMDCVGQQAIPALLTGRLALLSVSILDK